MQLTTERVERLVTKETEDLIAFIDSNFETAREREALRAGAKQITFRVLRSLGCFRDEVRAHNRRISQQSSEADKAYKDFQLQNC